MQGDPTRVICKPKKPPVRFKRKWPVPNQLKNVRDPMFDWIAELTPTGSMVLVEVGSQWGWWAYRAAKQLPEAAIWCVDPWATDQKSASKWSGAENLWEWHANLSQFIGNRVYGLHGTSKECHDYFDDGELDCVFIDADHATKSVALDLKLWVPKVRSGGLVLGHDWDGMWGSKVRPAVESYFKDLGEIEAEPGYQTRKVMSAVWKVRKTW